MKSLWNQILQYLYIKKRDPDAYSNQNTRIMHGINRLSILMFLVAMVVVIYRLMHRR